MSIIESGVDADADDDDDYDERSTLQWFEFLAELECIVIYNSYIYIYNFDHICSICI